MDAPAPVEKEYVCPQDNQMPVWLIDTSTAGLYCLDANSIGTLIQAQKCTDESGQLLFNGDGRLVCFM